MWHYVHLDVSTCYLWLCLTFWMFKRVFCMYCVHLFTIFVNIQSSCGSLNVLESPWVFFPDFQGLESPWKQTWSLKVLESVSEGPWKCLTVRDHSFARQIFPNSAGQFAKFYGSPWQIFHIYQLFFYDPRNWPNMQHLPSVSHHNRQIHYSLSTK